MSRVQHLDRPASLLSHQTPPWPGGQVVEGRDQLVEGVALPGDRDRAVPPGVHTPGLRQLALDGFGRGRARIVVGVLLVAVVADVTAEVAVPVQPPDQLGEPDPQLRRGRAASPRSRARHHGADSTYPASARPGPARPRSKPARAAWRPPRRSGLVRPHAALPAPRPVTERASRGGNPLTPTHLSGLGPARPPRSAGAAAARPQTSMPEISQPSIGPLPRCHRYRRGPSRADR